jgi:hypothetical protein
VQASALACTSERFTQREKSIEPRNGRMMAWLSKLSLRFGVLWPTATRTLSEAADVGGKLQQFFNEGVTMLTINDDNFGDPAVGFTKHFAATVKNNGRVSHYACQEGQTINFESPSS